MWSNIKSFFSKKPSYPEEDLSPDFEQQVKHAISLIEVGEDIDSDEDFLNYLVSNGIARKEAVEILLFLPIAFVRHWLSTVKWPDSYLEYVDSKRTNKRKYSETKSYQIIWQVTSDYFQDNPKNDTVFKIGTRSAEFNAINKLMWDNPDSNLEKVTVSKTIIMR